MVHIDVDQWDKTLNPAFAEFYREKNDAIAWQGRWEVSSHYFNWKYGRAWVRPSLVAFAREGAKIVGASTINFRQMAGCGKSFLLGELADLAVAPSKRGTGLFGALLQALLDRARKTGPTAFTAYPTRLAPAP